MTDREVAEVVKRICKENKIDFLFVTNKITSWSVDGNNNDKLVRVIDVISEATND